MPEEDGNYTKKYNKLIKHWEVPVRFTDSLTIEFIYPGGKIKDEFAKFALSDLKFYYW